MTRERFIPFSKKEISGVLSKKLTDPKEREEFLRFCQMIGNTYHFKFYQILEDFKTAYGPVDPDNSGHAPARPVAGEAGKPTDVVALRELRSLLTAGNYNQINDRQLQEAFGAASPWGLDLKVDVSRYEVLELFYRGEHLDQYQRKWFVFQKKFEFPVYNRVVLAFRLKEGSAGDDDVLSRRFSKDKLYLKLFKNVPTVDLEMLFPDTKIVIRSIDQAKVVLPLAAGSITTVYKIASYILRAGNPIHLWSQIGFWVLVGSLFGIALKGFLGYKNTVEKYLKTLTTSLYFQNLDNNSGVFKYLLDDAEEEECKELILAYFFLFTQRIANPSAAALDACIEAFFKEELNTELDFEVEDALRKLAELGLMDETQGLGVLPLPKALARLSDLWRESAS